MCLPLIIYAQERDKGIKFEQGLNWEQIKDKAKSENKYIFMDVFATWCGPCKMMDKEVYSNNSVGNFMNDKVISVRVQMDSSLQDNEQVKAWYADSYAINKQYKINAYPTFLFFSPNGRIVYRDIGFRNVSDFLKLINKALNTQNLVYDDQLENYKKGERNYRILDKLAIYAMSLKESNLARQIAKDYVDHVDKKYLLTGKMILFVLDVAKNKKLSDSLAIEYKSAYLDKLSETELCTEENFIFIDRFSKLINSKDNLFYLCYYKPDMIDSIISFNGWAKLQVNNAITREEMEDKLLKDGNPVFEKPDWDKISFIVHKKYEKVNAELLVLNYKIQYYELLKDWPKYAKMIIVKVDNYGALGPVSDIDFNLNNYAWEIFLHSTDIVELTKALAWSDSAIKLNNNANKANWMDTKANLLYKLGRVEEAIALENKIIAMEPKVQEFKDNLKKMEKRQSTWINK